MPKKVYVVLNWSPTFTCRGVCSAEGVEGAVVDGGEGGVVVDNSSVVLVLDFGK